MLPNREYPPTSIPAIISILSLLLGIPEFFPYGYYILLRLFVCATAAYISYYSFEIENRIIGFISIAIVLLFNPIVPVYLPKEMWILIDVIVAIFFGTTIFIL
jgi:hypothetical protein